jgi:hypothetical protein
VQSCDHMACLALVQSLRAQGIRVEVDVRALDAAGLAELARVQEIPRVLYCRSGAWLLAEDGAERALTEDDIMTEAETWL